MAKSLAKLGPPCQWFIIIYLVPPFRDVLGNFMCYIRSDKAPEDRIHTVVAAENGLKMYVTMPIAIATDHGLCVTHLLLDNFGVAQGDR